MASLRGAGFALVVHVLAAFGRTPVRRDAMLTFGPMALVPGAALVVNETSRPSGGGQPPTLREFLASPSEWASTVWAVAWAYTALNFALCVWATGGGSLREEPDGHFALVAHGQLIRALDDTGVQAFNAWQVRFFSGHVIPFLLLPGLYLFLARRPKGQHRSPAP